jgi:lysophospholipase L1-like esterase
MKNFTQKVLMLLCLIFSALYSHATNITFQVDMTKQKVTSGVYLGADWNGWNMSAFNQMTDPDGDGIYKVTVDIAPGSYNYRTTIGLDWNAFENLTGMSCGAGPQGADRNIVVTNTDTVLDVYCFNSCSACVPNVNITFRVNMSSIAVAPQGIHVAGTFNSWNPSGTLLTNISGSIYEVTLPLSPGTILEYKFLNGNSWGSEEIVFGPCELSSNRFFTVPKTDSVLDMVCFGYCSSDCAPLSGIKVACIGDSVTWGAGIVDRYNDNYPFQLRDLLGNGYATENFGNSGKTMLLHGDDPYWNTAQYKYSQLYGPNIVLIMLGTNDSKAWNYPMMPAEFNQDYLSMINAFRALPTHPEVYAVFPPKAYSTVYGINDGVISDAIIPKIKALAYANGVNIIDMHLATQGVSGNFPDGVHPNAAGSAIIATKDYSILTAPKPVIIQKGNALSVSDGFGFQWYLNGKLISGANNSNYTALATGTYTVGVKINQMTDDFLVSAPFVMTTLSKQNENALSNTIVVSPNPGNVLQIDFETRGNYKLSVFSISGKVVLSDFIYSANGHYKMRGSEQLEAGLYLLKIVSGDGSTVIKKWNKI